jgi:hypothetical protein
MHVADTRKPVPGRPHRADMQAYEGAKHFVAAGLAFCADGHGFKPKAALPPIARDRTSHICGVTSLKYRRTASNRPYA